MLRSWWGVFLQKSVLFLFISEEYQTERTLVSGALDV
jgi:hypothetical protein